ncbi:MAG: GyrI-like domain-containing protein [Fimbriimonas sp.]
MTHQGENSNGEIPALWQTLMPRFGEIAVSGVVLGVGRDNALLPMGEFEYLAGAESRGPVPEGMEEWDLPAGTYAKVDTTLNTLRETMESFYAEWLPESSWESAGQPTLEIYPPDFQKGFEVLFSVKSRE